MLLHFQQRFIEFYAMLLLHVIWCTLVDKIIQWIGGVGEKPLTYLLWATIYMEIGVSIGFMHSCTTSWTQPAAIIGQTWL